MNTVGIGDSLKVSVQAGPGWCNPVRIDLGSDFLLMSLADAEVLAAAVRAACDECRHAERLWERLGKVGQ